MLPDFSPYLTKSKFHFTLNQYKNNEFRISPNIKYICKIGRNNFLNNQQNFTAHLEGYLITLLIQLLKVDGF